MELEEETTHPSLDAEDQALLKQLTPEGAEPGSPASGVQQEEEAEDNAAAPAAPAQAPAAQAPAAQAPAAPSPAPAAPAVAPAPSQAPAPAAAAPAPAAPAPAPEQPQGNVKAALRASRANERRLRDQNDELQRQLEEAKKGGGDAGRTDVMKMTDAELSELEENFPLQAALVREVRELRQQVQPTPAPKPDDGWQAPTFHPDVQAVIDEVPVLQAWQFNEADQPKFQMAAEFDQALMVDPIWKAKSPVDRFKEAARRTEEAIGAQAPAAPAPAPRQDPTAVIAATPSQAPAGISDFRGGGPAAAPALDFRQMSDEAILHSLIPED